MGLVVTGRRTVRAMSIPTSSDSSPTRKPLSLDWWVRDADGRLTVAQWPNPALWVWLVALVVRWSGVLSDERSAMVRDVGRGALIVWSLDELVRGASPFRRVLGAVVLGVQLYGLLA